MTDAWREDFERWAFSSEAGHIRVSRTFLDRSESGDYVYRPTQRAWERYQRHHAIDELKAAVIKVLRLEQIVAWLNDRLKSTRR